MISKQDSRPLILQMPQTEFGAFTAQTDGRARCIMRPMKQPHNKRHDRQAGRRLDSAPVSDVVALATKVGPAGRLRW